MHRMRCLFGLIFGLFSFLNAFASESLSAIYLGSREGDPASIVDNVSTIHGDYSEVETDLVVPGPDPLTLSRSYSSRDNPSVAALGGWRFCTQCFLTVQKDPKGKTYTTVEGKFERTYAYLGTTDGSILTYVGWQNSAKATSLFKLDIGESVLGVANSARGSINAWTNLKNHALHFSQQNHSFELNLNDGGKRWYVQHPSLSLYLLEQETLPSGNKVFYEYDDCQPVLIRMMNRGEEKVLSWIKIQYGNVVHVESSDGQTVDYQFEQSSSGNPLLTKVLRSNRPSIDYEYRVVDENVLLTRKELPEGRFVEVDYYTDQANKNKVQSVTTPAGVSSTASTQFTYGFEADGRGFTEIQDPLNHKTIHQFDEDFQLVSIEQYLDGSLYRVQRKRWGRKEDLSNLIGTTIEDAHGHVYYATTLGYDDRGNILEEREYGNLTGANPHPIELDEDGNVQASQESHVKTYSHNTAKGADVVTQRDAKGNGASFFYRKGTNILMKKFILKKTVPTRRWFYDYNEDGVLAQVIVDDGDEIDTRSTEDVCERRMIQIITKNELPHVGAPEVIEEKYFDVKNQKEVLLKRMVNQFDLQGNIALTIVYDANGQERYALKRAYENGLLTMESDPIGNETTYSYDENHNLTAEMHAATGTSFEYGYDLKNRLIHTVERDAIGNLFERHTSYDPLGHKNSEVDRFGHETTYALDDLGRVQAVSYPEIRDEASSTTPTYTYQYNLFDHPIAVTDPKGKTTLIAYTVHGQPTKIGCADDTQELFKYDAEGSLHRHLSRDGTVKVFEYDYLGRVTHIERYARSSQESGEWLSSVRYSYDAFHISSEKDETEKSTDYTYDGAGRLASLSKGSKRVRFIYDPLGRTKAIQKWKTDRTFTLQVKEYDLLDQVIEERIEDSKGNTLLKYKYTYDKAGHLSEVIGYPQNRESILKKYHYDGFGRLVTVIDAETHVTTILYDDKYINDWGQRVLKQTTIDPLGNQNEEIFDTAGHLAKVIKKNKKGQILAESECMYDAMENPLLEKNAVLFSGELLRTDIKEQTYHPGNQLQTITLATQSAHARTTSFQYNWHGDLSTKLESGDQTPITYRYGDDGKLRALSFQGADGKTIKNQLLCDQKGNITNVRLGSASNLAYEFDTHNQLTSERIQDEFGSYQVTYALDGEGLITSIQLPDGSSIQYTYEGPLVKEISRLANTKKELYNYRIASRDLMGNVLEEILIGHAGARSQKWDLSGRRTEICTDFFQDKIPEGGYDPLRNIRTRELDFEGKKLTVDYEYDDLSHLISEQGAIEHRYSFDSLGNRLKKDSSPYTVNALNQVLEANGATYTFDGHGNLDSKTVGAKTWTFQHNALNQLVLIKGPDQTNILFTYDLCGKRLSKKIEEKGKKSRILRYFYLGNTELGALDEKGGILELRVPSNPNYPETAPCIAIEIKKEIYVPMYDLQGNVACLVDPERRIVVESYRYSAFGEETITDERGRSILNSSVGNPWRTQGERIDKEVGLIYFGCRYYDPEVGRWISPDPAGAVDGPNLYAFCHNNPLTYVDYFGLAAEANNATIDEKYFYGEYEPHCYCERHRDCKRGGDIGTLLGSVSPHCATVSLGRLFQTRSASYEVGAIDLANGGIGFINGINNSFEEAREHALRLSQHALGAKIQGIYNATHAAPADILECIAGACRIPSPPVQLLKNRWNRFSSIHGSQAKFLQICHSGGAIHVFNALSSSPKAIRGQIIVLAISPAAIIPKELCYEVHNYASKRDFIPRLDLVGKIRYGDQLILLEPHPDAPRHDHGFDSPTFQDVIKDTIQNYMIR